MQTLVTGLLWLSAIGCGLMAGLYFAFSTFVMSALGRIDQTAGIAAMNEINRVIVQSLFLPVFMGSTLTCLVLAVLAPASPCNAQQRGAAALRGVRAAALAVGRAGFVGVELTGGTHVDAEGADTEALAVRACGEGWPQPENVAALRALAVHWAAVLATAPDRPPTADSSVAAAPAAAARWRVIE